MASKNVVIGRITAPQGIKGEVRMQVLTDFPERFDAGSLITLNTNPQKKLRVEFERSYKSGLILKFEGIDTRNDAEALRGADAVIGEDELADLGNDKFYVFDLIGLEVRTDDGKPLGKISEILQGKANDVYVTTSGVCIPAIKDVVTDVNLSEGTMTIHPIEGMI